MFSLYPKQSLLILPVLSLLFFAFPAAGQSPSRPLAITVHVATDESADTDLRIQTLLNRANALFAPVQGTFCAVEVRELPQSFAVLETIRERHRLKKYFKSNTINLFLVDEIQDPNPSKATRRAAAWQGRKPSGRLSGAHIEAKGRKPQTYIVLSRASSAESLAHELGHFFGLPHHRDPNNIMSYGARRNSFEEKQLRVLKRKIRFYKKRNRLLRCYKTAPTAPDETPDTD